MSDTDAHPALKPMLCFDLYSASRALTAVYRDLLAEHDLTYPQYLVLVVLWHDRRSSVKHLSGCLHLDYGTLTPLLRRMEKGGLVTRTRNPDDERSVDVELTGAGAELEALHHGIQRAVLAATGLSDTQARTLQHTLKAVARNARP